MDFFAILKIRIPIIRSLGSRATYYQLFHSYITWSLHINKDLQLFMQWYVAERDFLCRKTNFLIFSKKKRCQQNLEKLRLYFVVKCCTFVDSFTYHDCSHYEVWSLLDVYFRKYWESNFEFLRFYYFHFIFSSYAIPW